MSSYSQHIHTKAHKYYFELKYRVNKQTKTEKGVIEGSSADAVILQLLAMYPDSTGKVKRLVK